MRGFGLKKVVWKLLFVMCGEMDVRGKGDVCGSRGRGKDVMEVSHVPLLNFLQLAPSSHSIVTFILIGLWLTLSG